MGDDDKLHDKNGNDKNDEILNSKITSSDDVESPPQQTSLSNSTISKNSSTTSSSLNSSIKLVLNEHALNHALMALRFGVFADAVNTTILQPNFPFLVLPGNHPVRK